MIKVERVLERGKFFFAKEIARRDGVEPERVIALDPSPWVVALATAMVEATNEALTLLTPRKARADWAAILARLYTGERVLVEGYTQAALGGICAQYSKEAKKFKTQKAGNLVYILRIA